MLDEKDCVIVLATDGVWDVMENEEVMQLANAGGPAKSCQEIVTACARRWDSTMSGRRDDITAIVIDVTHSDLLSTA